MSSADDLGSRLRATFVQELGEQVREMNAALLALEQRPGDTEPVRTLFRSAHTIKGAARVVNLPVVEQVCHALESVFEDLRKTNRTLSGGSFSLVFAVVDALSETATRMRSGLEPDASTLSTLLPKIPLLTKGPLTEAADSGDEPADPERAGMRAEPDPGAVPPSAQPADSNGDVPTAADDLVRVSASRLDRLLAAVGELSVSANRITRSLGRADDDIRRLDRGMAELAGLVRELRLRPLQDAWEALPRAVRDAATASGKQVHLETVGGEIEVDRSVVDALREPLLHLIRNAVDHGLEDPDERERRGKDRTGEIHVGAELVRGRLLVSVSDDGRGLDEEAIREEMRLRGRPLPESSADLAEAVFTGGLSTSAETTSLSGRGVGLDIVRNALERIGGTVDVRWAKGIGTTFVLETPPSPSMIRAVFVRVGATLFGIPSAQVERISRIGMDEIRRVDGQSLLQTTEGSIPVYALSALLGPPFSSGLPSIEPAALLLQTGARRAALLVDEVVSEDEIVVRPVTGFEERLGIALGATVLPSGVVAVVLAPGALVTSGSLRAVHEPLFTPASTTGQRRRVLLADDSITTRLLERSILEAAGFDVTVAVDGADALLRLESLTPDVIIADVEMPRMDGFTLCRRVREEPRLSHIPLILVTALDSPEDRARGMDAGANAYIVKSAFDQTMLLQVVHQVIGDE